MNREIINELIKEAIEEITIIIKDTITNVIEISEEEENGKIYTHSTINSNLSKEKQKLIDEANTLL
jgi:hypothetical protein